MRSIMSARRTFLLSSIALGIGTVGYVINKDNTVPTFLLPYNKKIQVLLHCTYHLFPQSTLGPGAIDLNIASYMAQVFEDDRILKSDKEYLLKGIYWVEESAYEKYMKSFLLLSHNEKESLFHDISAYQWGKNFIYTTLSYIFEALLSSPSYGSNHDEIGWKWLSHNAGFPQPPSIVETQYDL